jgi:hypothetical protein
LIGMATVAVTMVGHHRDPRPHLVDSDVVFRGFASCDDSDGSRVAQYFIVPRPRGGFVMFSVQSNMKTPQEQDVTKEENLAGFRKAVLLAVSPR